jgi:hypothetical protein
VLAGQGEPGLEVERELARLERLARVILEVRRSADGCAGGGVVEAIGVVQTQGTHQALVGAADQGLGRRGVVGNRLTPIFAVSRAGSLETRQGWLSTRATLSAIEAANSAVYVGSSRM